MNYTATHLFFDHAPPPLATWRRYRRALVRLQRDRKAEQQRQADLKYFNLHFKLVNADPRLMFETDKKHFERFVRLVNANHRARAARQRLTPQTRAAVLMA